MRSAGSSRGAVAGKLKALPSRLTALRPGLGGLPPVERTRDEDRALHSPWRKLYKTARWRALRMAILARDLFTCQWPGCGFATADTSKLVADHREPHRDDEALFWSPATSGASAPRATTAASSGRNAGTVDDRSPPAPTLPAQDYETPTDADANRSYLVTVRCTDAADNATDKTITVTITDVAEGSALKMA